MFASPSTRRALTAVLAAALLVPSLAACGGNPIETLVHQASGGKIDLGGGHIPTGFPAEVPLYNGKVTYGIAIGDGAGKAFNVTIRIPDAAAGDQIRGDLEKAGFTLIGGTDASSQGGAAYDGAHWGVVLVLTKDNGGWLANYTVTPKQSNGTGS
jgi:hypothetical protein